MKGLILCAGKGTRLRPLTFSRPKHLLPVANKPVVVYAIEKLAEAGIKEIGIVIAPMYAYHFQQTLGNGEKWGVRITLIEQREAKGLADAVLQAKDYINNASFVLFLGDILYGGDLFPLIERFNHDQLVALLCVKKVDNPERFGVVQFLGDRVIRVIEKPKAPPSNYAITGVYVFSPSIFESIAQIEPSARGEYELTDAIQRLIQTGHPVSAVQTAAWWRDTGKPEDIIQSNQNFLQQLTGSRIAGNIDDKSEIIGPVRIDYNVKIRNAVIRGPVIISRHSIIEEAFIGPYTSISPNVTIKKCDIENSIILENTVLIKLPYRIDESLIGGDSTLIGSHDHPKRLRLWTGDQSQIIFPK